MADETGQAPNADAQAAEAAAALAATAAANDQASKTTRSAAELEAMISELRRENAAHRTENKSLKTFKEQKELESLTETQRLQKQADDLKTERESLAAELRTERGRNAVTEAAARLGVNAKLASQLITVEYDDAGKAVGVDAALNALIAEHPYLITDADTGTGGNPGRPRGGAGTFTSAQISNPEFYRLNEAAIKVAAREGRILA